MGIQQHGETEQSKSMAKRGSSRQQSEAPIASLQLQDHHLHDPSSRLSSNKSMVSPRHVLARARGPAKQAEQGREALVTFVRPPL